MHAGTYAGAYRLSHCKGVARFKGVDKERSTSVAFQRGGSPTQGRGLRHLDHSSGAMDWRVGCA